jgi:hypothetical protein
MKKKSLAANRIATIRFALMFPKYHVNPRKNVLRPLNAVTNYTASATIACINNARIAAMNTTISTIMACARNAVIHKIKRILRLAAGFFLFFPVYGLINSCTT